MAGTTIDSLVVSLGLDPSNFSKGQLDVIKSLKKIEDQANKSNTAIEFGGKKAAESFEGIAKSALGLFAIVAGGRGLEQLFTGAVQTSAAVGRLSANINMSTEALSGWQNAAKAVGGSADGVSGVLTSVSQGIEGNRYGIPSQMTNVLKGLGIDLSSDDPGKILLALADKLHAMPKQQALFVAGQAQIDQGTFNLLDQGSAVASAQIAADGNVSPGAAAAAEKIQADWVNLETQVEGVANAMMEKLEPAITQFTASLMNFIAGFQNSALYKLFVSLNKPPDPNAPGTLNDFNRYASDVGKWLHHLLDFPSSAQNPLYIKNATPAELAVRDQGMAFFQSKGWTANQAAGIMGNVFGESKFDIGAVSPDGGAHGLFQWRGARWAALVAKYGPNPTAAQQFQFAQDELNSSESASKSALLGTTSAFGAGVVFDTGFERNGGGLASQAARGAWAAGIAASTGRGGVPLSAQRVLAQLRSQAKTPTTVKVGSITINAKNADAKQVAMQLGKTLRSTALSAQANTGLS